MMSAPESFHVYRYQPVQNSSTPLTIYIGGSAGPAFQKKLMERIQEVVGSPIPGAFPPEWVDDGVDRGYTLDCRGAEPNPSHPSMGQLSLTSDKDEQHLSQERTTSDQRDEEMTNAPPESFLQQEVDTSNQAIHSPEALIAKLKLQLTELAAKNDELNKSTKETTDENRELGATLTKAVRERDELVRLRQSNQMKIKRLNEMIIKSSQKSDEPLDEVMQQETFKIRNMATEVIKTYFPGEAKYRVEAPKRLEEYFRHFYDQRLRKNLPEGRRRLLISLLFGELQHWFFGPNAKRFGLPTEMEKQLQQFEKQIEQSNKVDAEESLEWRTRTVSYACRLNLNNQDVINHVTRHIALLLAPMILPGGTDKYGNPDKRQVADLENAIFELCTASSKLALRFRSSRTKYEFKTFPDDTCQTAFDVDPDLVKPMDTEGSVSRPVDQSKRFLFCTLWGALVKTRPNVSGESGERVVLEPAQVILYEPDLWGKPRDTHGGA